LLQIAKVEESLVAQQRRLDEVLDKNSEGTFTPSEKARLGRLVAEAEQLTAANARLLAGFAVHIA